MLPVSGTRHPALRDDLQVQRREAMVFLRNRGIAASRVIAVDIDRIAYLDHNQRAMTALLTVDTVTGRLAAHAVDGWPV